MLMGSGLKWFGGKLFQTYKLSNQIWSFCLLQGIHWWKRIFKRSIIKSEPMEIGSHNKFHVLEWPSQQEFEAVKIFMILQTISRFSNSCICFASRKIWALHAIKLRPMRISPLTKFPSYSKAQKPFSNEITVSFKFPAVDMIRSSLLCASSGNDIM